MRFITRFCANRQPAHSPDPSRFGLRCVRVLFMLAGWLSVMLGVSAVQAASNVQKQELQAVYDDGALYLTARLRVRLDAEVEDALKKGVPLYFVSSARLVRKRWYWYDADVVARYRISRLSYVPLTRQWQVRDADAGSDTIDRHKTFAGSLHLRFASLDEALAAVQSVTDWKIATLPVAELDSSRYVVFDFRMDLSELPRPFRMGAGSGDAWDVAYRGVTWPEHRVSADLTAGQAAQVVAEPVEIRERSQGAALHRQRGAGGVRVLVPPVPAVSPAASAAPSAGAATGAVPTPSVTLKPEPEPASIPKPSPAPARKSSPKPKQKPTAAPTAASPAGRRSPSAEPAATASPRAAPVPSPASGTPVP